MPVIQRQLCVSRRPSLLRTNLASLPRSHRRAAMSRNFRAVHVVVRRLRACATATLCTTAGAAQLESEPAPAFVVSLCGHLRTFPLLAKRLARAVGRIRRRRAVPRLPRLPSRLARPQPPRVVSHGGHRARRRRRGAVQPPRAERALQRERDHRGVAAPIAASEVTAHARVVTTPRRLNVSDERCIHGLTCVGDVSIQLQSLSRVHRLAGRHLRGELRLTEAQLDDMIVIRSRPDVTWNTDVADGASAAKARRRSTFGLGTALPYQDAAGRLRNGGVVVQPRAVDGRLGDIVWAAHYRDVSTWWGRASAWLRSSTGHPPDSLPFNKKVTEALSRTPTTATAPNSFGCTTCAVSGCAPPTSASATCAATASAWRRRRT